MAGALLTLQNIDKSFGETRVLKDVSLSLGKGEILFLVGASGCGKTTLLRVIAGFETADRGSMHIGPNLVFDHAHFTSPKDRRLGYVLQEGVLFPHMNAYRNIAYGLGNGKGKTAAERARVEEVMALTEISELAERKPHQLSGGQQQRVALARALAPDPSIMLLDEPFSALDEHLRSQIRHDVIDILRRSHSSAIIVTHDRHEALSCGDRIGILVDGELAQIDTPKSIYRRPCSPQIARFMSDHSLLIPARLNTDGYARTDLMEPVPVDIVRCTRCAEVYGDQGHLMIRADQLVPTSPDSGGALFSARIQNIQFHGNHSQVDLLARHTRVSLDLGSRYSDLQVGEQIGLRLVGKGIFYAEQ